MTARNKALAFAALAATYMEARRRVLANAEETASRIGPRWLGLLAWKFLYGYSKIMGVQLASEEGASLDKIDPKTRYLIVWHPHGFIAWSALFMVSKFAVEGHPHGREWFAMVAPALFRIPVVSEALMLVNGRRVDKSIVENLLKKGASIAIQPGGVKEQMLTDESQEKAVFPANLGFIRMAIKYGMDLLPAYVFNENQLFNRVKGFDAFSDWIYKTSGFGLPIITAKFGIPMAGLFPLSKGIHVRWGEPVPVGEADEHPTDERVEEVFIRYLDALKTLFDKYAHECLPSEVAARGLKIMRLDGKPLPERLRSVPAAESVVVDDSAEARTPVTIQSAL